MYKKARTLQDIKEDPRVQSVYETAGQYHFELTPGFQVDGNEQHHWSEHSVSDLCDMLNNGVTEWKNDPTLEPKLNLESDPFDSGNMHDQVETMLRDAQKKKAFKDSDIRVGGAKKEMAAIRKLLRFGLNELNENEAQMGEVAMIKFVTKDKVFPKFDVKDQMDKGVSSGATFLKMKLRESFPSQPQIKTAAARKVYVGFANLMYDTFIEVGSVTAFAAKQKYIYENIKKYVCSFLFSEDYTDLALRILPSITNKAYRTEFIDFDDAYTYLGDVCSNSLDLHRNLLGVSERQLREDFGFSHSDIKSRIIDTIHGDKTLDDTLQNFANREVKNVAQRFLDSFQIVAAILAISDGFKFYNNYTYSFFNQANQNPYWVMAIARLPELKDKHKRPFDPNESSSTFIQCFFSSSFKNFICYLTSGITSAATDNYALAVKYERISEDQAQINFKSCADRYENALQRYQKEYSLAVNVSGMDEFDKLIKADEISRYMFSNFEYHTKLGRLVSTDARWENLHDNSDRQNYINEHISKSEEEIKRLTARIEKCREQNKPHPDDWTWAAEYLGQGEEIITKQGEEIKPKKRKMHGNVMLDYIERIGGLKIDKSKVRDIEHIKKFMTQYFGFKAYEYGQSLKDEEASEIIYHFLGAISDFAEILNIDLAGINHKMGLSMGFATRGSGSARASYFSLGRIINLTKSNGDGSVAHEMAHYLDNIIPAFDNINTYSYLQMATAQKDSKDGRTADLTHTEVKDAVMQIMAYILYGKKKIYNGGYDSGNGSMIEYVAKADSVIGWRWRGSIPKYENLDDLPRLMSKMYGYSRYSHFENLSTNDLKVFDIIIRDLGIMEHTFYIPSKMSVYYHDSKNVGGDYWVRPWELFARAFEVYVSDKMAAANRYNNFLYHGDYQSASTAYIPDYPYPQFNERKYLFGLFENLITQVKKNYNIGDFIPFTTELNGYTKVDIDLTDSENTKAQKKYTNRLKILKMMLSSDIKTIDIDGYTIKYKLGDAYTQHNGLEKYYLKSVSPTKIVLADQSGKKFTLQPHIFVQKYKPEMAEMATGGEFINRLENLSKAGSDAEFYQVFLKAYENYVDFNNEELKRDYIRRFHPRTEITPSALYAMDKTINDHDPISLHSLSGETNDEAAMLDRIIHQKEVLENDLTALYSFPDWKTKLRKIDADAFNINRAQDLRELKDEILLVLANRIIDCYDTENLSEIFTLQLAIDAVNSVTSKTRFKNSWEHHYIQAILRERNEFTGRKADERTKAAANEAQKIIAEIFNDIQINVSTLEDIEKRGKEFEEHKQFGFKKVSLSQYGSEYHTKEESVKTFGKKPNTAKLTICTDPNGKFYFGADYSHKNGASHGCWLSKDKAKDNVQDCYNDFYIETALSKLSYWSQKEYNNILAEIKEKLSIPANTIALAQDSVEKKIAKAEQEKKDEAEKEQAAIEAVKSFAGIGDSVWMKDQFMEKQTEFIIDSFTHADFIGDYWAQEKQSFEWPEYVVCVKCHAKDPSEFHYNEHKLFVAIVDGTLRQANYSFGIDDSENPFSEPLKIERKAEVSLRDKIINFYAEKLTQESIHEEIERGKEQGRVATAEKIAEYTAKVLERNKAQFGTLIDAIDNKDYKVLSDRLHLGNKTSRKVFEEYTGIKLGKTLGETHNQLKALTGYVEPVVEVIPKMSKEEALAKAQKAKDEQVLNKKLRYDGVVRTRKEQVEFVISNGGRVEFVEVDKIKEPSRTQWNRWDNYQQDDFERKRADAGKKKEYRLFTSDNSFYEITKAEYDYAQEFLANKLAPA